MSDFNEILCGEAVFCRISAMGQIPTFRRTYFLFSYCSFGFGKWGFSYRLQYTVVAAAAAVAVYYNNKLFLHQYIVNIAKQ